MLDQSSWVIPKSFWSESPETSWGTKGKGRKEPLSDAEERNGLNFLHLSATIGWQGGIQCRFEFGNPQMDGFLARGHGFFTSQENLSDGNDDLLVFKKPCMFWIFECGLLQHHQVCFLSPQKATQSVQRCPLMHGLAQNLKLISLNLPILVQITARKDRVRLEGAKSAKCLDQVTLLLWSSTSFF